jgi:hypothetical protein
VPRDRCGIGRYGRTIGAARISFAKGKQACRRPDWPKRLAVIPVTDKVGPEPHKEDRERGSIMRKLFILLAFAFALVSIGAATVVTTALTSDAAMAQATR